MGFVYLIWAKGTNSFKIGKTENIGNCLQNRQTYSRHVLELAAYKEVQDFSEEEKRLKLKWSEFNVHGEWFDIPINEIPVFLNDFEQVKTEISEDEYLYSKKYHRLLMDAFDKCYTHLEKEGVVFDYFSISRLLCDISETLNVVVDAENGDLILEATSIYNLLEVLSDSVERETKKVTRLKELKDAFFPKPKVGFGLGFSSY